METKTTQSNDHGHYTSQTPPKITQTIERTGVRSLSDRKINFYGIIDKKYISFPLASSSPSSIV